MARTRTPTPEVIEKETKILQMRKMGLTWAQIGQSVGLSQAGAYGAYRRALSRVPDELASELRKIDNERIDALITASWPDAMRGSARHLEVLVKLLERRAKLMGLDAPILQRIEVVTDEIVDEAILEMQRKMIELEEKGGNRYGLRELA